MKRALIIALAITGSAVFSQNNPESITGVFKQNSILSCQNTIILNGNREFEKSLTIVERDTIRFEKSKGDWNLKNDTLVLNYKEQREPQTYKLLQTPKGNYLVGISIQECIYKKEDPYTFKLRKGSKTIKVDTTQLVELYLDNYKHENDSVHRKVSGIFKYMTQDSIALIIPSVKDKVYYSNGGYNDKIKTKRYEYFKENNILKFNISQVNSMVTVNRKLEKALGFTCLAAVIAGVVVSPLVSIENKTLNWNKIGKISGISGGVAVLTLVISGTCWDRHHQLKPGKKNKEAWVIQR